MNQLVSHIEFLLHGHNCVIVPGLGGFVVNSIHSRRDGVAQFYPPTCELVFNRELTYNDGLLAQSYMRTLDLTFESAMWKIERAVRELKQQLREQKQVKLGNLGSFILTDNNRFTYKPGTFVRPALYGLNKAQLKPLIQMQKPITRAKPVSVSLPDRRTHKQRRVRSVGITAAAVAAIALLMFVFPVSDTAIGRQSAQLLYETEWLRPRHKQEEGHIAPAAGQLHESAGDHRVAEASHVPSTGAVAPDIADNSPRYYIVMGVFQGCKTSTLLVETLKNEGFSDANYLRRPGRFDVYATSFDNKSEAEDYLREVHKQYPKHSDAWILKR